MPGCAGGLWPRVDGTGGPQQASVICQLRTYRIREGEMDAFLALWRDHVVPAREALGFRVVGAWRGAGDDTFVWIVAHEAPDGWEAADRAYYDSPERAALPRDPRDFLVSVETRLLRPVE